MDNNFKIISREESVKTDNLKKVLSNFGKVEVVTDIEGDLEGYIGLSGVWRRNTTAWDLLFKDLEEEYTWIIEDDVAFNKNSIEQILNYFKNSEADLIANWVYPRGECVCWGWWRVCEGRIPLTRAWRSLNQICRVSPYLIRKVREYRESYGMYFFHEILFATLSRNSLDFREFGFEDFFTNENFNWEEIRVKLDVIEDNKIYHPVKSDEKHTEICNSY